jgi:sacsin
MSGEQFGQHQKLTTAIQGIIKDYPEGTQILKELLQNADDANARSFVLMLDKRSHGSDSLLGNRDTVEYEEGNPYTNCRSEHGDPNPMQHHQGPALLVFDDAIFQESDFQSIQSIQKSQKKLDPSKTGQVSSGTVT